MTQSSLKIGTLTAVFSAIAMSLVSAQSITVGIEEYASIGTGARMNLMTTDPSGRLFVNDQRGGLFFIDRETRASNEYLDLSNGDLYPSLELTDILGEPGFQSFAFHPDFATAGTGGFGKFYTMHSSDNTDPTPDFDPGGNTSFHSVLLEWNTSDPTANTFVAADAANPFREVLRFDQPFGNHNAGQLAFNPSTDDNSAGDRNNLYVGLGDGGSSNDPQNNGQDASNPYGAILRIDPLGNDSANGQYGIVNDNVFALDAPEEETLAEIFSFGLRNPQRFGWDDRSGDLYIADIGQNAFEEINLAQNGGNFGWNAREGSAVRPGFQGDDITDAIDPVAAYDHGGFVTDPTVAGRAVTVGEVVLESGIAGLDGQLLLGDFPNGIIYTLDVDNDPLDGGQSQLDELLLIDVNSDSMDPVRLLELLNTTSPRADLRFSFDTGGDVFILNKRDGIVRRLVANPVPEPSATAFCLLLSGFLATRRSRRRN